MWYPTANDVRAIHYELVEMFASSADPIQPSGVRDENLLASACSRPQTALGRVEKYTNVDRKAAALLHSLIKNHAFHNGNKRTALVTVITFLSRNERRISQDVSDDDVYALVTAIAADRFPSHDHGLDADEIVAAIGAWLRRRLINRRDRPRTMRTNAFLDACVKAGAQCKISGGSFIVSHGAESIWFRVGSREIQGIVVKRYLAKLHLSEGVTGIPLEEFEQGLSPEQAEIRRFRGVLERLADA